MRVRRTLAVLCRAFAFLLVAASLAVAASLIKLHREARE